MAVPEADGGGGDGVAPLVGEGHAVQGRDVEEEEVAGAGGVELCEMNVGLAVRNREIQE